ncbi:glycosyltransferase, partial [Rhizobium ruizarguesonis]
MSIRVSCIIATLNSARFLPEALRSITPAFGTGRDIPVEILVADGGSTDDTLAIAK